MVAAAQAYGSRSEMSLYEGSELIPRVTYWEGSERGVCERWWIICFRIWCLLRVGLGDFEGVAIIDGLIRRVFVSLLYLI